MFKTITQEGQGVQGIYRENGKLYRSRTCHINGIKCQVEETNFALISERTPKKKQSK